MWGWRSEATRLRLPPREKGGSGSGGEGGERRRRGARTCAIARSRSHWIMMRTHSAWARWERMREMGVRGRWGAPQGGGAARDGQGAVHARAQAAALCGWAHRRAAGRPIPVRPIPSRPRLLCFVPALDRGVKALDHARLQLRCVRRQHLQGAARRGAGRARGKAGCAGARRGGWGLTCGASNAARAARLALWSDRPRGGAGLQRRA